MIYNKRELIDEQTSPLHRIMWISNIEDPAHRAFENNVCAFHIGNGYFLSVAHCLYGQAGHFKSIAEDVFQKELLYKMDGAQKVFFDQHYFYDDYQRRYYLNNQEPTTLQGIAAMLKQKRFDTRWITLAQKKISRPHVLIQFSNNNFYGRQEAFSSLPGHQVLYEAAIRKYTFFLEVELVESFASADIALFRIVNTPDHIIELIPAVEICTEFLEEDPGNIHCLQSAPSSTSGRLLNEAKIEGMLEQFNIFPDEIGGNIIFEGLRYLLKGYFRFGSSGAPYVYRCPDTGRYKANAVQSEASGIQLSIKNDKEGNFQYINAIATPLYVIKEALGKYLVQ